MRLHTGVVIGLGALCLLLVGSGCAKPTPRELAEERRLNLRKEVDDEVTVGREIAAKLVGNFKYFREPDTLKYVNLVGQTLARQAGRPELNYRFAVLDTDDMNAYACPGGFVFITRGLLKRLQSESELGGVLAHEIAHVNEKHMYQALAPKKDIGITEMIARFLTRGYGDLGASISKIVDQATEILLKEGYGKDKELAADQAGVTYASTVGYDPNALVAVIERLEKSPNAVIASKTHPPYDDRIASLKKYLNQNGLDRVGALANAQVMKNRFETVAHSLEKAGK